jgi:YggT family protein
MIGPAIVIDLLFRAYFLLIIVWVLGSWFPQWRYQPWFKTVEALVRPYLDLFRGLPLQIGMMDLTPMVAIFVLYLFQNLLLTILFRGLR